MAEFCQQAFKQEFYGVDKRTVKSPEDMCSHLIVESFVLNAEDMNIGSCLSNSSFMYGHYIDCLWDNNWNLIYSDIC